MCSELHGEFTLAFSGRKSYNPVTHLPRELKSKVTYTLSSVLILPRRIKRVNSPSPPIP